MLDPVTGLGVLYAVTSGLAAYARRRRIQQRLQQAGLSYVPEVRTVHLAEPDTFFDALSEDAAQAFVEAASLGEYITNGRLC